MNEVISSVLITCPQTGEAVETVLRLRPSAFEALRGEYSFRCSRCGQVHTWRKDEAWLRIAPAPPEAKVATPEVVGSDASGNEAAPT